MTEHISNDEQVAREAIRESFPLDAGMPAEKTWELHMRLRPAAVENARQRRLGVTMVASLAAALAVAAGAFGLHAALTDPLPEPTVADRLELEYSNERPSTKPPKSSLVPAMALRAINPTGEVLHFTAVAETAFGPRAGASTEEMWFDPKTGAGRLVRVDGRGEQAVTTTVISDGSDASVTTKRPGQAAVTEPADMSGRLGKSFDKLSAYRKMLESGVATVTAHGTSDGAETYTLRAEVDGFGGGEYRMVMEAVVRAEDYLPIS